jgi:CheY-like chemotaxis protein
LQPVETILLIDDDEINNYLNTVVIQDIDLAKEIIAFTKATDGLQFLKNTSFPSGNKKLPSLILLDVNMPEMDGWDFLSEYAKLPDEVKKQIVLVMLSSSSHKDDIEKAKKIREVSDYISKPLTEETLNHIIKRHF